MADDIIMWGVVHSIVALALGLGFSTGAALAQTVYDQPPTPTCTPSGSTAPVAEATAGVAEALREANCPGVVKGELVNVSGDKLVVGEGKPALDKIEDLKQDLQLKAVEIRSSSGPRCGSECVGLFAANFRIEIEPEKVADVECPNITDELKPTADEVKKYGLTQVSGDKQSCQSEVMEKAKEWIYATTISPFQSWAARNLVSLPAPSDSGTKFYEFTEENGDKTGDKPKGACAKPCTVSFNDQIIAEDTPQGCKARVVVKFACQKPNANKTVKIKASLSPEWRCEKKP